MNPAQLIKTFLSPVMQQEPTSQNLKAGQIVAGKITKLFPNQTAEVQIGSQKVIAQLEAPLSANERYWFQVQPGEGKIHLKVINSITGSGVRGSESVDVLLAQFGLQNSKENNALMRFMLKEQLPMSKETMQFASQSLKGFEPLADGLATIKVMAERGLPFTKDTFQAMVTTQQKTPLHQLVTSLSDALSNTEASETVDQLQSKLQEMTLPLNERMGKAALPKIVGEWLSALVKKDSPSFELLKTIGIIPPSQSEEGLLQKLASTHVEKLVSPDMSREIDLQANSAKEEQDVIKKLLANVLGNGEATKSDSPSGKLDRYSTAREILSMLNVDGKVVEAGEKKLGAIFTSRMNVTNNEVVPMPQVQLDVIDKISKTIGQEQVNWSDGQSVLKELKRVLGSIGFDYEGQLMSIDSKVNEKPEDTLKPLLIKYLNEQPIGTSKEAAENLLNKLTGIQLLNNEQGLLHQVVTQVPITFVEKTLDLTMQWSGRKNDDGKIDPNYCRVLFYLELEKIGNTIVDMQVQNRILSIGIVNDNPDLRSVATPFVEGLKENLKRINYTLSSLTFELPADKKAKQLQKSIASSHHDQKSYTGVDFRI